MKEGSVAGIEVDHPTACPTPPYSIRSISLAVAGSTAGILGLSSGPGLLFFLLSVLSINALILVFPARGAPHKYLLNPPPQSPLGFVLGIGGSVATAAAIASPGIMAYGASAVLGGAASSANARGVAREQKVVRGKEGEDLGDVAWYLLEGLKGELLSFILWWTFWTAIVHGECRDERKMRSG